MRAKHKDCFSEQTEPLEISEISTFRVETRQMSVLATVEMSAIAKGKVFAVETTQMPPGQARSKIVRRGSALSYQ